MPLLQVLLVLFSCTWLAAPAHAAPAAPEASFPPSLQEWIPWVEAGRTERNCAHGVKGPTCSWPGLLQLTISPREGRFTLHQRLDKQDVVELPFAKGTWPTGVRLNGKEVPVLASSSEGSPTVVAPAGTHTITGQLTWLERPQTLKLPEALALVELTVDGKRISEPVYPSLHRINLGEEASTEESEDTLSVEVSRLLEDGVPFNSYTKITLRVSGDPREITLPNPLLNGSRVTSVSGSLPSRFEDDGALTIGLQPGTHDITLRATHLKAPVSLSAPELPAPWPSQEFWAFEADEAVRSVLLSGPVGIDAARTTTPESWRSFPTYLVDPSTPLLFEVLREGDPSPPPNLISLSRQMILDMDGQGWSMVDTFDGTMSQDWRLNIHPSATLAQARVNGEGEVITDLNGQGVELRQASLSLYTESRIESPMRTLSSTGWDATVDSLQADVCLPLGYKLLTASGPDQVSGAMLNQWTLFDFFFVLIISLAIGKVFGWPWGGLALVALSLAHHEAGAPQWLWIPAAALTALSAATPEESRWTSVLAGARWATTGALLFVLCAFSLAQIKGGMFPSLQASPAADLWSEASINLYQQGAPVEKNEAAGTRLRAGSDVGDGPVAGLVRDESSRYTSKRAPAPPTNLVVMAQRDPNAIVQTGNGVPKVSCNRFSLSWDGPVRGDNEMTLYLLSPLVNGILSWLRIGLLLALAFRVAAPQKLPLPRRWTHLAMVAFCLLLPLSAAKAEPSAAILGEMEKRLFPRSPALVRAPVVSELSIKVKGDRLTLEATVSAGTTVPWRLPGPAEAWRPSKVTIDGKESRDLVQLGGYLFVRLSPGVHSVRLDDDLSSTGFVNLQFKDSAPKLVTTSTPGWEVLGLKPDGSVDSSLQLVRQASTTEDASNTETSTSDNLTSQVSITREIQLGVPWAVYTTVVRRPASRGTPLPPLSLSVPLLEGESVTTAGVLVEDSTAIFTMGRGSLVKTWKSTLKTSDVLELVVPEGALWTEKWTLACNGMFHCSQTDGGAPVTHLSDGVWTPTWLAWPGDRISLALSTPPAVEGRTTTLDGVQLSTELGLREQNVSLQLNIRSSQGGSQLITLPEDITLRKVTIDGRVLPLQLEGRDLRLRHQPGGQTIVVEWSQPSRSTLVYQSPEVSLNGQAVNVGVHVTPLSSRWIVALAGPGLGPVPLYWVYLVLLGIFSPLLGKLKGLPLRAPEWFLLGLGLTQVSLWVPALLIGWFLFSATAPPSLVQRNRFLFVLWAGAFVIASLMAAGCLFYAIQNGLLVNPEMQVQGNGSSDGWLKWSLDWTENLVPSVTLVSLPLWTWKILMLAWSLWLSSRLLKWIPWTWNNMKSVWADHQQAYTAHRASVKNARDKRSPKRTPPEESE